MVSTPVTTVMTACIRMMSRNPNTPPMIVNAATTSSATTLVTVPELHPSRSKMVAVASVAKMTRTVSHPTVSTQDSSAGSRLPLIPNAARESTIVGADPRLPAIAMNPHSRNENRMPSRPAISACQKETPKPSPNAP
jgi:hypothetical protein